MGQSTTQTTQQSSSAPWATGQGVVSGIVGQLNPLLQNSGLNPAESGAINQLTQNAAAGNPYAPAIGGLATNLLGGGGATNQAGAVNNAYQNYYNQTQPLASNTNYDPTQNPAIAAAMQAIQTQATNSVNSQFAGAGRLGSGQNAEALGLGLAQGEAPLLLNQYNQNVQNQQGAAQNLYNAGMTTAGTQAGLTQQGVANQLQGANTAQTALTAQNYGPLATLAAQQMAQSIPAQNLGLLSQIGIPIAGLGTNSTGSSSGTAQESGAQEFGQIAGGLGSLSSFLFGGGGPGGTAGPTSVGGAPLSSAGQSGGLFGAFPWSDRRLKEDIKQVGALFDGTPVYRYRYKGHGAYQIGLMAQDVERDTPEAVHEIDGFKAVDYRAATEKALMAGGC